MTELQQTKAELFKAKHAIVQLRNALSKAEYELNQLRLESERVLLEAEFLKDEPSGSTWDWNAMTAKEPEHG